MKLKYPISDLLAFAVVIIGTVFDLLHHPQGKRIFYSGFVLMALSHIYHRIYIPASNKEGITWRSYIIPVLLLAGVGIFFTLNTRTAMVLIFFGLALSFVQRTKFLNEVK